LHFLCVPLPEFIPAPFASSEGENENKIQTNSSQKAVLMEISELIWQRPPKASWECTFALYRDAPSDFFREKVYY
jgi:hypothetical protein